MDLEHVEWIKSSRSSGSGSSDCVEVARTPEIVGVRDSNDRGGPVLTFAAETWLTFVGDIKRGVFDR